LLNKKQIKKWKKIARGHFKNLDAQLAKLRNENKFYSFVEEKTVAGFQKFVDNNSQKIEKSEVEIIELVTEMILDEAP